MVSFMSPFRSLIPLSFAAVLTAGALFAVPASSAKKNGTFSDTGSTIADSIDGTQSLLDDGRVLITGGENLAREKLSSAEIYDPSSKTFTATGSMAVSRESGTATVLNDGRVLIVGGTPELFSEIYDPGTGVFARSGSLSEARSGHTASLLNDGRVLIAGGLTTGTTLPLMTTEIYDPQTQTFEAAASMSVPRAFHTANVLEDGSVLVAGGYTTAGSRADPEKATATAELYDPKKSEFVATGSMSTPRTIHNASQLRNGTVLVTGGTDMAAGTTQKTAELYKPSKGKFVEVGSMTTSRSDFAASVGYYQGQEFVLVAGGLSGSNGTYNIVNSAESYNPNDNKFRKVGAMSADRVGQFSTRLPNRQILMAGGSVNQDKANLAELYEPVAAPGAVNDAMKTDVTMTRATVTWKQPRRDGGAKVTNYQYRIKKKGKSWQNWKGEKKKKLKVSGTSKYSKTFSKLKKGKKLKPNNKYVIELRGKNEAGPGANQKLSFRTQK